MRLAATLATLASLAMPAQAQVWDDSVAGNVFDLIQAGDANAFACLVPQGAGAARIWDKRVDGEPVVPVHLFDARYADGTSVTVQVNAEMAEPADRALRIARPLGHLPTGLRQGIDTLSLHGGAQGFHGGAGQIVLYDGQVDRRIGQGKIEESLFHESIHAALDRTHADAPGWRAAQAADGGFATGYAAGNPAGEDLAETALIAFALLHHPGRIAPVDAADLMAAVPNRIAYLSDLLPPGAPIFTSIGPAPVCP